MCFLVNFVKEKIQSELVEKLYKASKRFLEDGIFFLEGIFLVFVWVTVIQLTRTHVDVILQSEIFERLLEEAEQMHIKRKEATEMLKVQ